MDNVVAMLVLLDLPVRQQTMDLVSIQLSMKPIICMLCWMYTLMLISLLCTAINECTTGQHNCDQGCVDTEESFYCTCNDGFRLASDGHSCVTECGGRFTTASGTFQTPGYPSAYPQENLECEWIIDIPDSGATIEFTVDDSPYGINGGPTCTSDHIEFFDGTGNSANSLRKLCGLAQSYSNFNNVRRITTTESEAKVVFTGSEDSNRPSNRVGVKVNYRTITSKFYIYNL